MERGIRNGDHLSPLLFLLVAEALQVAIMEVKSLATSLQNSILSGSEVGKRHLWNTLVPRKEQVENLHNLIDFKNFWIQKLKVCVEIKSLFDTVGIIDAQVFVNTALMKVTSAQENILSDDRLCTVFIENSATLTKTQVVNGVTKEVPITIVEEKAQRRLEVKARSTLMIGIPNEHQLKFNSIKDAKQLLEALVSQLELLGERLSQKDVNQKLLRSLSPEWSTHTVVWRNKADLDTMSMDDLYKNLKVHETEVKGMSSSSSSTQNMDFVSSSNNNTSSTNRAVNTTQVVNTANRVSAASTQVNAAYSIIIANLSGDVICSFFASQPNTSQRVHEDLEQIHRDDMEEMDLR
nr:hypothetical protein [Tanacetum cinerariifolium]